MTSVQKRGRLKEKKIWRKGRFLAQRRVFVCAKWVKGLPLVRRYSSPSVFEEENREKIIVDGFQFSAGKTDRETDGSLPH